MIEAAAEAATDYTWQRASVTVLTVVAFAMTAGGLLHAYVSTREFARSVAVTIAKRHDLARVIEDQYALIQRDPNLTPEQRDAAQQAAEVRLQEMEDEYNRSARIPLLFTRTPPGVEPVAESLVHGLSQGSQVDLWVAGVGLILGLAASIWGTWIP
jgi:hypothetical protein